MYGLCKNESSKTCKMKVVPGLEPGLPEGDAEASKSGVITTTLHNLLVELKHQST